MRRWDGLAGESGRRPHDRGDKGKKEAHGVVTLDNRLLSITRYQSMSWRCAS